MGNVCDLTSSDKDAAKKNREIESFLKNERRVIEEEVKLLLLGTGGSGKSTIAKQMKIIHLSGFSQEERVGFKNVVYHNVLRAAQTLIQQAKLRKLPFNNPEAVDIVEAVPLNGITINYTSNISSAIDTVWKEPSIKQVYGLSNEYQLDDSAGFFLDNCERFSEPGFIPTEIDILRVRAKTTGIVEIHFVIKKKQFRLVDVGGQRNERKKWIHCFQDVTAIIYCCAMNEYDLLLEEDSFTNRMHESLTVFEEILNNPFFVNTPIILFLNKRDLFDEKIQRIDLNCCFPVYDGGLNKEKGAQYIKKKFLEKNVIKARELFAHFTCATETGNVRHVFNDVEKMLIGKLLDQFTPM